MKLTKENARDGLTLKFFQNGGIHTLRKTDETWSAVPHGDAIIMPLPESDFGLFEIVEDVPEPPLVVKGGLPGEYLDISHPDAAQRRLELLGPIVDGLVRMVEVILDSHPPVMANWDLLHAVLVELNEAQSLITGQESEPEKSCDNCGSCGGDQGAPACVDKEGREFCKNWASQWEPETVGVKLASIANNICEEVRELERMAKGVFHG